MFTVHFIESRLSLQEKSNQSGLVMFCVFLH
jgi:hypothetical protein